MRTTVPLGHSRNPRVPHSEVEEADAFEAGVQTQRKNSLEGEECNYPEREEVRKRR